MLFCNWLTQIVVVGCIVCGSPIYMYTLYLLLFRCHLFLPCVLLTIPVYIIHCYYTYYTCVCPWYMYSVHVRPVCIAIYSSSAPIVSTKLLLFLSKLFLFCVCEYVGTVHLHVQCSLYRMAMVSLYYNCTFGKSLSTIYM